MSGSGVVCSFLLLFDDAEALEMEQNNCGARVSWELPATSGHTLWRSVFLLTAFFLSLFP